MTTVETLRAARDLVDSGWCQGASARTRWGRPCLPDEPRAVKFCPLGAIQRVAGSDRNAFYACLTPLCKAIGLDPDVTLTTDICHWNDAFRRRKKEVLAALERAIAVAEEQTP